MNKNDENLQKRRRLGQFYTPFPFVDEAHCRISSVFGPDWKEEYVVIDCCCGTKNLTRDYRFRELYCSTLEQAELDIGAKYNPEALAFRYDFLNESLEDLERKAPGLVKAFRENRKILVFINPPYATAGDAGAKGTSKGSICKTAVNAEMKAVKIGPASQQLYAQFLYRIMSIKRKFGLTDCNLAFFCKPNYLTGGSYEKFRKEFFSEFKFENGMLFNAGHFAECSSNWGINFSIWKSGETTNKSEFVHDLVDLAEGEITTVGSKTLYNIDGRESINEWTRKPIKGLKTFDEPNMMSAIKIRDGNSDTRGRNFADNLGYFSSNRTNIVSNMQGVGLYSSATGSGGGSGISPDNFARCCSAFAARRLVNGDWINDKDEYTKPNTDDPRYREFEADAHVFCLFDSNSQQSSLRKVEYKGKKWDVRNEFFWIPAKQMAEWADEEGLDETYAEAVVSPDRHMARLLSSETVSASLSPEAKAVLEEARRLVRESMKFRADFDADHPKYQIMNWDAGWYQVKAVLKEHMPSELKAFRETFRKLADKMRPMVYELGFLRK